MTVPTAAPLPSLRIDSVVKRFGGVSAVSGVTIMLPQAQLVGLMGPNGSGKSTLFHMVAGFHRPTSGSITFGDQRIDGLRPYKVAKLGVVRTFQHRMLFERLSVRENIAVALRLVNSTEDLNAILSFIGLADQADRPAGNLAYGHARKLAVGIALGVSPRFLLLDEPAAGLDLAGREQLLASIDELSGRHPALAIVLVTHHLEELPASTSHALLLREGSMVAAGPVSDVLTSELVSACFAYPVAISRSAGRWACTAQLRR